MISLENKRIFIVATTNSELNADIEMSIKLHIKNSSVYTALDGTEASFKVENVIPHIAILDYRIPKVNAIALTEQLIRGKERTAVIILTPENDKEHFIDEVVTGQVQFLTNINKKSILLGYIHRALNWISYEEKTLYHLRFFRSDNLLIKDGEEGRFVYFVRSGRLKAFKKDKVEDSKEIVLGYIEEGEFVGEMAYINGEARSANVVCMTDCELIEIPSESLDSVLFSKPAWSKALMRTLSKRLKNSNQSRLT